MIDKDKPKRKDFPIVLSDIIAKTQFIAASLINAGITKEYIPKDEVLYGSGLLLTEISEDLELINKALYPDSKIV